MRRTYENLCVFPKISVRTVYEVIVEFNTSLGRFLPLKNLQKLIRDPTVLMNCLLGCSVEIPDQFFQIYCRFLGGWFSVDLAPFLRRFCTKGTIEDASYRSSPLYLSRKIKIMYGGTYRQKLGWRVVPSIYIRATHTYLFPTRAAFWNVMSKKRGWMFHDTSLSIYDIHRLTLVLPMVL